MFMARTYKPWGGVSIANDRARPVAAGASTAARIGGFRLIIEPRSDYQLARALE